MKNLCILAGTLLLLAMSTFLPYSFYVFLRWAICLVSIYVSYGFLISKLNGWALVFGAIGIVFNPIIPIYLTKASWLPIDFIGAILFFIAGYSAKKKS